LNLETFHLLRPAWLWALLLLVPIGGSVLRRARSAGPWEQVCDPHLLRHLVTPGARGGARWPLALLALGWTVAALALAGPTWERLPQQTFREPTRTVFVLGLADSMNQRDVRPSRLARARHKLLDATGRSASGSVALVVYRDEAFAVTPITDDPHVLREAIPLLETKLMPGRRVYPSRGIEEALRLLEPVGVRGARIVLVSDGADDDPQATETAVRAAAEAGARVSVLAMAGDSPALAELAQSGSGNYAALAIDDGDLDRLLAGTDGADLASGAALTRSDIAADDWKDMGAWLLWIPLALAPFAFRRGWAAALLGLLFVHFAPEPAHAIDLDVFERPDQKGARAFAEGRFAESAEHFEDPAWQAAARYRAGDFAGAAETLAAQPDAAAQYNLGNALAKAGKLEAAVAAYDRTLATTPSDEDARFNRDLVKKVLEEQPPESNGESGDPKQRGSDSQGGSPDQQAGDPRDADSGERPEDAESDENGREGKDVPSQDQAAAEDLREDDGEAAESRPDTPEAAPSDSLDSGEPKDPSEQAPEGDPRGMAARPPSAADQQRSQWMARLPDDPGGLLRERIRRDYLRKQAARSGEGGS
jgi:Ca-activated chloride channel family protein